MSKFYYWFYSIDKGTLKDLWREIVFFLVAPLFFLQIFILKTLLFLSTKWLFSYLDFATKKYLNYDRKNYRRSLTHLRMAYGKEKKPEEIKKIAQDSMRCIYRGFFFYLATSHIRKKSNFFQMVDVHGEENLRAAYKRGKGVICIVPHMSSWELAAITPPMLGYKTSGVSERLKSCYLQALAVNCRQRRGMKNISRHRSYPKLIDVLNQGECLIIMIDQDTKVRGAFVDFFGHQAYTPMGAARLALDTEAAVVPMAMTQRDDGFFSFIIYPELKTVRTDNYEKDLITNTQLQTKKIEDIIRQFPAQWVWLHRRWHHTQASIEAYFAHRQWKKERRDRHR